MCGICGIIHDDASRPVERSVLEAMNRTMIHRGPDDAGVYLEGHVGLAMRRLAIIDVDGGHQPVADGDGIITAVINGEIYNYRELKRELAGLGYAFKTAADAEVVPSLYREYGDSFLERINGMFALALWDAAKRRLLIARDRMGKKPLYWTHRGGAFIFASELKALIAHPLVHRTIDRAAIAKYLAYEYIPAPASAFVGIHKLGPGEMLTVHEGETSIKSYWDVPCDEISQVHAEWEIIDELRTLIRRAVERRLMSDVPLGVFLSGGLDSSTVVAMMAKLMEPSSIKTFSIAFDEKSFDESSHARRVADFFGTDHREQTLSSSDLVALVPEIADVLDEPFADNSIIPTYALAKFTRRHVTVALGGDGGDELFAGYPTFQADRLARVYRLMPRVVRERLIEPLAKLLPASDENISFDFKVKQFLKGAGIRGPNRHMVWLGAFSPEEQMRLWADMPPAPIFDDAQRHWRASHGASRGNRMLYLYEKLYLQDDILAKVDRASMASSLEVRAPLLDVELVDFVSRLPYSYKLRGMTTKYLLKKAMRDMLPRGIAARAKKGFGSPAAKWFKGELKEMLCDELNPSKIRAEGFFRPATVRALVDEHLAGRADHRKKLWTLLMFELWLKRWT